MLKILYFALLILIIFSCTNSTDVEKFERFAYFSVYDNDAAGFYSYNFEDQSTKLITKKNIVKSSLIADNGRFVVIEKDPSDHEFNYYGICDGNLLDVPLPDENEYFTDFPGKDLSKVPMQIDNAGHNFLYFVYKIEEVDNSNYFRPFLVKFNCEEWKMEMFDLHNKLEIENSEIYKKIEIIDDVIAVNNKFYFLVNITSHDNISRVNLIKIDENEIAIMPVQILGDVKLVGVIDNEFRKNILIFKNNELIIEEDCVDSYKVGNLIDVYDFMNQSFDYNTIPNAEILYGFSDVAFRSMNIFSGDITEYEKISDIYSLGKYSKSQTQSVISQDNEVILSAMNGAKTNLLIYHNHNQSISKILEWDNASCKIWGISREFTK